VAERIIEIEADFAALKAMCAEVQSLNELP